MTTGWTFSHLWEFDIDGRWCGDPSFREFDDEPPVHRAKGLRLGIVIARGVERFVYTYDYGENWRRDVSGSIPLGCRPPGSPRSAPSRPPAWGLQEAGEVAPLPQLRDLQYDRAGTRLQGALAVAVAVGDPLTVRRTGQALDLKRHQPLGRKADHLAKQIGGGGLPQKRVQGHHVLGHRGSFLRVRVDATAQP